MYKMAQLAESILLEPILASRSRRQGVIPYACRIARLLKTPAGLSIQFRYLV